MAVAITMQDSLISEVVDEDMDSVLLSLNVAAGQGRAFIGMDDPHGYKILFNIPNIMTVKELDE